MYYAGIGSTGTPEEVLKLMTRVARGLDRKGYRLRSGGAKGADTAFAKGTKCKDIFLANGFIPAWTKIFTEHFHPNPQALKNKGEYVFNLMNRNAMQILGEDGDTPVEFVVCWTKDGKASGGTGQAIRIAEYFGIPVFNLKNEGALEQLKEFINGR